MRVPLCLFAEGSYLQFARLQSMTEWWHWLLLVAVCCAIVAYVALMYYRDSVELLRPVSWLLVFLRVLAFAGILFYFFDLEKRSQQQMVNTSRVLLLIDTSQSMGLRDSESGTSAGDVSRIEEITNEFAGGDLLSRLRAAHDVTAYRFDEGANPVEIASLPKLADSASELADPLTDAAYQLAVSLRRARLTAAVAGAFLVIALLAGAIYLIGQRLPQSGERTAWSLLVSMLALIASVVVLAVASLRSPDVGVLAALGLRDPPPPRIPSAAPLRGGAQADAEQSAAPEVDWAAQLKPRGVETRLGEAVRRLVNQERGGPVAAIVLFSDGRSNAGVEYTAGAAAAQEAGIPVYTVGLGGSQRPVNVRVVDLETPQRVYPGDGFTVTGYLQAFGLEGRTVRAELFSASADAANPEQTGEFEDERRVTLAEDGKLTPVRFEVTPDALGRRVYQLRVTPPQQDHDGNDNVKTAEVQIVERKNRTLLIAGGPTREYRFLRNMLYRDQDTTVDVLLQTATVGVSQDADRILFDFPKTLDEMFEYDAVVAFDPDWQALSETQIDLLDRWVAEQAGGLIVIAGPVHTPQWANQRRGDRRIDTVKGLYPVVFYSRGSVSLDLGRFGSETAWPLDFTRDGREAEYLWLEDDAIGSEQAWSSFEGVYGYYAVKDAKPGARVLARYSDPEAAIDNQLPIYLAAHFYGAGRVLFQASGEIWRLRAVEEAYFDRYYTKLIRWISQGRLLRDSSRGLLLVDKERCLLGDQIVVRAILTDAQHEPLMREEVVASLIAPDGDRTDLTLRKVVDSPREGTFAGQFTAMQEGDYRLEMTPPEWSGEELLTREVRTRLPDLEIERPERNDPLMKDLAEKTGGEYYVGVDAAVNRRGGGRTPIYHKLEPQDQVTLLPGTPDKEFERLLMTWLMGLICGVLCLEWLVRRLSRLA